MGYNYIILGLNRYNIIISPGIELGNEFELWEKSGNSSQEWWSKKCKKDLPVRELNPGHPRDRQVY